jgi:hypothetical protein
MKPVVDGLPLSTVRPIEHPGAQLLWISTRRWHMRQLEEASAWRRVASPLQEQHLQTQLADLAASDSGEIWHEAALGEPVPVTLTFTLAEIPTKITEIAMVHPLPPPQLGEYGLVADTSGVQRAYHIMDLPLEARQRWHSIGEQIRALSNPLTSWPAFTDSYVQAVDELPFLERLHTLMKRHRDLTVQIPPEERDANARFEVMLQIQELQGAHENLARLRSSLEQEDWLEQWAAIQQAAQLLAQDYLRHHLAGAAPVSQMLPIEQKMSRRRSPKAALAPGEQDELHLSSNLINHEIIKSLRPTAGYVSDEIRGLLEHKHSFAKQRGQITIQIHPLMDEGFDTLLAALNTLGDGCIDTYVAVMAIAIERYGVAHLRTAFEISPDDILAMRGKKRSNGSYAPFQRADVIKELKTLSQARVIATMPRSGRGRRAGTEIRAEGALIELLDFKIGEYSLVTGEEIWERRSIILGKWVSMIPELDSQTAVMLRQVLAYSAKNERFQKRLGLHLSIMFRVNARHSGQFPKGISLRALLEMSGIVIPKKHPADFRDAIEQALACLQRDQVIGRYWQIVDASPTGEERQRAIREQQYGWLDHWLDQQWNFAPPEQTKQRYRALLPEGNQEG